MTARPSFSHQVRVGFFVVIGLIIATASIFIVGGEGFMKKHIEIYADFESVQGLNEGSVVSLAGIKVGNIKGFSLDSEPGKIRVIMQLDELFLRKITEGSTIEVRTAGALGDKFLYIAPGPVSERHLNAGEKIDVLKASDIMSVLSEKGGEARRVFDIMKESEILLKSINNENRIERILTNLSQSTSEMKIAATDARQIMATIKDQNAAQKASSSIDKLDRILAKIEKGEGTLGALINDSSLHESLKSMFGTSEKKKTVKSLIRSSIEKNNDNGDGK